MEAFCASQLMVVEYGRSDFAPEESGLEFNNQAAHYDRLHRKSRIRTTSRVWVPRASTSLLPSAERAKLKMRSDLKSVNCLGGSPLMGWLQMLETPLCFCT